MKAMKRFGQVLSELNYIIGKRYRKLAAGVFFLMFIGAVLEMLGISAVLPFIQAMTDSQALMEEPYIQYLMSLFGISSVKGVTIMVGMIIILLYLVKNIFLSISVYCQVRFRTGISKQLKYQMMEAYMNRPYSFFVNMNSGDIVRGISGDVPGVQLFIEDLFKFSSEVLVVLLIGLYIFHEDPAITLGVMVIALFIFVAVVFGLKRKISHMGELDRKAFGDINRITLEMTNGIKDIMIKKKQFFFLGIFDDRIEKNRQTQSDYQFLLALPDRFIEAFCICGIIAVVLVRILMGVDALTFVPKLAIFAVAAFRMLPSMTRIISSANAMVFHKISVDAVYENMKAAREYMQSIQNEEKDEEQSESFAFRNAITINGISWRYEGTERDVLYRLNMVIHKGEAVGVIGESGSGKSTLADILLGLYRPAEGTIEIDGRNIYDIPAAWSRMIGYVPQGVFLRDNTIRENVAFGEKTIDDAKVWDALENASLKQFVESLPDGLDTVVGENGIKFSGGQKQRVAIARALYAKPDILILDEATSALDNETELAVMEAIESLQGTITMVIIAHRLTTIRKCDRIYEIKEKQAYEVKKETIL